MSVRSSNSTVELVAAPTQGQADATQVAVELVATPGLTYPTYSTVSGTALVFPGYDTSLEPFPITRRNRLSNIFYPKPGTNVVIHVTTGFNDAGNVGIVSIDGAFDVAQNAPAAGNNYNLAVNTGAVGRGFFVYSYLSATYRSGLTGSITYDATQWPSPIGVGVTQTTVELVSVRGPGPVLVTQTVTEIVSLWVDPPEVAGGGGETATTFVA